MCYVVIDHGRLTELSNYVAIDLCQVTERPPFHVAFADGSHGSEIFLYPCCLCEEASLSLWSKSSEPLRSRTSRTITRVLLMIS
jgi:hypothetical protein